ncbi:MAG: rhodanese-like domain-containing protein, partial [Winogradskyella sp.]|nr:rhodanese-like domain-containing protein [Winogradskyella sp.]
TRLSRVGYDNTLGYLEGGIASWQNAGKDIETLESVTAEELAQRAKEADINILDVRKDGEYQSMHVDGAQHFALDFINEQMDQISKDKTYYVHCAGGYRSVIASSILKARGFTELIDVEAGFSAIKHTDLPMTDYVCPSTLKS